MKIQRLNIPRWRLGAWLAALGLLLGLSITLRAQTQPYRFDHWTTDNGLPHNFIRDILQTRDGYLWLTTLDGLVRYDGVRFTVFDKSNTPGLTSNSFSVLAEDAAGTLWIGTNNAGLTRYQNGVFHTFTTADGLPENTIRRLYPDPQGGLLITTLRSFLYWRAGRFVTDTALPSREKAALYLGRSGTRWTFDQAGLHRFKAGREDVYPLPLPFTAVAEYYEDQHGDLWLGTYKLGLYHLKDGALRHYAEKDGVPLDCSIYPLCEDRDGNQWFGTEASAAQSSGILRFKDGRFARFTTVDGLSSDNVRSMCADREGNIWIGTTDRGLNRLTRSFITAYSTKDGLAGNNIFPLLEDRTGNLWIGSTEGLSRFQNGRFINYSAAQTRHGVGRDVEALFADAQNRLWVGSRPLSLLGQDRFVPLPAGLDYPSNTDCYAILQDRQGALWFATYHALLRFKDGVTRSFTTKDGLPANQCRAIFEDRQGRLWVGTNGGLAYWQDGRFVALTTKEGLAGNFVLSLHEDTDGALWIGTYDSGLSKFKDGRFTNFSVAQGLFSNGVFSILEDKAGYFWLSSSRGISRVSRAHLNGVAAGELKTVSAVAYGKHDGMLLAQCNAGSQPGGLQTRDGKLWFPTAGGVVVIDPANVPHNPQAPQVLVETVLIDQARASFQSGVTLRPQQTNLEIQYTGLSFIKPEHVRFKYKLAGRDADWLEVGTRRTAYFSYLPPGDYTFRVTAANSDGVWNETGAQLRIVVLPPFYRTWWFRVLVTLSLIGAAVLFYRRRVAQLERARVAQEEFSRRLIESQEHERQRLAAELHDGLSQNLVIIKNRALLSLQHQDDPERLCEQIEEIAETADESLAAARELAHNLRPFQIDRLGLTKALEALVRKAASAQPLQFTCQVDPLEGLLSPELEINLYRVVQESINNLLKHAAATTAGLTITRAPHWLAVTIQDNGRGFSIADCGLQIADSNMRHPQSGGFGLLGLTERARILGCVPVINSAPGQGTRIELRIPITPSKDEQHSK